MSRCHSRREGRAAANGARAASIATAHRRCKAVSEQSTLLHTLKQNWEESVNGATRGMRNVQIDFRIV